jgi:hypothetical protein
MHAVLKNYNPVSKVKVTLVLKMSKYGIYSIKRHNKSNISQVGIP